MEPKIDQQYIVERDALIPTAEKMADQLYGRKASTKSMNPEEYAQKWNLLFHGTMNRLWAERKG